MLFEFVEKKRDPCLAEHLLRKGNLGWQPLSQEIEYPIFHKLIFLVQANRLSRKQNDFFQNTLR